MPKSKDEKVEEAKKKIVVVEEVVEEKVEEPPKVETPIEEIKTEVIPAPVEEVVEEAEKTNYLWIIIPTALLIGALVGGLITYFSGMSKIKSTEPASSPVSTTESIVTPTPVASPSSTLKKDELKVQVLNGSGVSGAAGKAKTLLEGLGYKNIDTGNATVSDLAQTEIAIKDTKKEYLEQLIKDLAKNYTAVEASKALISTSKYDLVITLGGK